jgi:pimeloyl-ACP methyl ester carboxylesterase
MRHLGKTPSFLDPLGRRLPYSIAEVAYRPLGGVEQWVMIRGENVQNPPLVMLHGGPGMSETAFFRRFNAALEKHFTVVYWDQRGTGKSFDRRIPVETMTLEQFLTDLDELIDVLHLRLGKRKVVLFGHSWGSALGVLYAAHHPEKVSAYAGSGQIGDWPAAERGSYAIALAEAEERHDLKALAGLRAIGPPPYDSSRLFTERTWLSRLDGEMSPGALWKIGGAFLGGAETSIIDLPNLARGYRFSLDAMWGEVSQLNLLEVVPELKVPVFFLLGRHDHFVPPRTSVAYLEKLKAPSKQLVWFEDSRHEPFVDEPERFNAAMLDLVRPAAA